MVEKFRTLLADDADSTVDLLQVRSLLRRYSEKVESTTTDAGPSPPSGLTENKFNFITRFDEGFD